MPCSYCNDLCIEFRISHPSELWKAIAVIRDNVADGTLQEITQPNSVPQPPFSEIANGGAWGDIMQYQFKCQRCPEQFTLHAETYHGSGGAWSVVKESERVSL